MKKLSIILVAFCLLLGCSKEQKFKISGTLSDFGNPDEPTMLYLKTRDFNEQMILLDSTFLAKDGKFTLKGKTSETDLFFLADKDNNFFVRIFVDPGNNITVTGTATDIPSLIIKGSETQAIYDEFLSCIEPFKEEQKLIQQNYMTYIQDVSITEDEFEKIETELVASFEQLEKEIENTTTEFIKANSSNIVAAYLVYRNTTSLSNSKDIEQQLNLLDSEMTNKFALSIKNRLEKVKTTEVGAILPMIELPDPDGKLISLESLRGQYVFVDFWASWCAPCIREIPNLKIAYDKYHEKGFEIISISLDSEREEWIDALTKYELNWLHVSDLQAFNSPIAQQLAVAYVPHTFLLDPDGVIIAVDLRGEELENRLAEIMQ